MPTAVKPAGLQFYYAISNPKPGGGAELQFQTEGPATVSKQIVTFAASSTPLTIRAGQPYIIVFYASSVIAATPPPFAGKIYVASDGYVTSQGTSPNAVTTYTADETETGPTIALPASPTGVAIDAAGKIYVSSCGGGVTTYAADGSPTAPTIAGQTCPLGVAVDAAGKIYLVGTTADGGSQVTTYTANGTQTTPTITGALASEFAGVTVDAAGTIYIADFAAGIVWTNRGDGSPSIATVTEVPNLAPQGVAVDAAGKIYVANNNGGPGSVKRTPRTVCRPCPRSPPRTS